MSDEPEPTVLAYVHLAWGFHCLLMQLGDRKAAAVCETVEAARSQCVAQLNEQIEA